VLFLAPVISVAAALSGHLLLAATGAFLTAYHGVLVVPRLVSQRVPTWARPGSSGTTLSQTPRPAEPAEGLAGCSTLKAANGKGPVGRIVQQLHVDSYVKDTEAELTRAADRPTASTFDTAKTLLSAVFAVHHDHLDHVSLPDPVGGDGTDGARLHPSPAVREGQRCRVGCRSGGQRLHDRQSADQRDREGRGVRVPRRARGAEPRWSCSASSAHCWPCR